MQEWRPQCLAQAFIALFLHGFHFKWKCESLFLHRWMWFVEPKLGKDNLLPRFTVFASCYTKQLCVSLMKNDAQGPNYSSTENVEQPNWEAVRFKSRLDKRHEGMLKSSFANGFLSCNHVACYGHILQHLDCIYPTCNRGCPGRQLTKDSGS